MEGNSLEKTLLLVTLVGSAWKWGSRSGFTLMTSMLDSMGIG